MLPLVRGLQKHKGLCVGGAAFLIGLQGNGQWGGGCFSRAGQSRPGAGALPRLAHLPRARRWQIEGKSGADLETHPRAQVPVVTQGVVSGAALGPGWNLMEAEGALGKGGGYGLDRPLLGPSCWGLTSEEGERAGRVLGSPA